VLVASEAPPRRRRPPAKDIAGLCPALGVVLTFEDPSESLGAHVARSITSPSAATLWVRGALFLLLLSKSSAGVPTKSTYSGKRMLAGRVPRAHGVEMKFVRGTKEKRYLDEE